MHGSDKYPPDASEIEDDRRLTAITGVSNAFVRVLLISAANPWRPGVLESLGTPTQHEPLNLMRCRITIVAACSN